MEILQNLSQTDVYSQIQERLDGAVKEAGEEEVSKEQIEKVIEVLELTAKVQHEVFSAVSTLSQASDSDVFQTRVLPWISNGFLAPKGQVSNDTSLVLLKEKVEKQKELEEAMRTAAQMQKQLELQINTLNAQLAEEKEKVAQLSTELEAHKLESAGTLKASEEEILELRKKNADAKLELSATNSRLDLVGDYESQVTRLRSDIRLLSFEKRELLTRISDLEYPYPLTRSYIPLRSTSPVRHIVTYRSPSPTRAALTNDIRANRLISRYSSLFSSSRLNALDILRRFVDEEEMCRRIVYIATVEAFHSAKIAYRSFKDRAAKTLAPLHTGPELLSEAVEDYVVRNQDLFDIESCVRDVVRYMDNNAVISHPAECDFMLINAYIREACQIAFEMQAVNPRIDIAHASEGELYDEKKYRRTYDSEYSAPLVAFYTWPALMDGKDCVAKGEAHTKRGALLHTTRRSTSPSPTRRGRSPTRRLR